MNQPPHPQPNPADGWPPAPPATGWPQQGQPGGPGPGWSGPPPGGPGWSGPPQQGYPGGPGPGWSGPPQAYAGGGWPPPGGPAQLPPPWQPPAARRAKRIPEDQPFVARPSLRKRALALGGLTLLIGLVIACPMGLAASSENGGAEILLAVPLIMFFFALVVGLQLWLVSSGGPVLAVGPAGLWIKTRPTRGQAIWLPWEAIDQIYRRRWGLEKMLCVRARDPRAGGDLGAFTALDAGMQQAFFGTGFTATVNFADRSEQEIMTAVVHYSAGRCRVA
ncbi:hypothetical protein [Micromonospora inositola]|uniref:PH domain-containing protein n=1 Tax=Micromonospora inositola TaxID=47865 RepID=A0A1C5IGA0_9ACTN|nr:hypothetical protein [Micromonospora inositola]SCG56776.1 hypothetical protein GA0070613_2722 [Micromonospora inositola]